MFLKPPKRFSARNKVVRVMPLGDSNTSGVVTSAPNPTGYRERLFWKMAPFVDFVGNNLYGPTTMDRENQGTPGQTLTEMNAAVNGYLAGKEIDIVLLMVGTNDMNSGDISTHINLLSSIIDKIYSHDPAIWILTASIIPTLNSSRVANTASFNAQIPGLVQSKRLLGYKIRFVDMFCAVDTSTYADLYHPRDEFSNPPLLEGYWTIADTWYAAIQKIPSNTLKINSKFVPQPTPRPDLYVFEDFFTNQDAQRLTVHNSAWITSNDVTESFWRIQEMALNVTGYNGNPSQKPFATINIGNLVNYRISVQAILKNNGNYRIGVVWRADTTSNYYLFYIYGNRSRTQFYEFVNGAFNTISTDTSSFSGSEAYNDVEVEVRGNNVTARVNGIGRLTATMDKFVGNTRVGLFVESTVFDNGFGPAIFDNFRIVDLDTSTGGDPPPEVEFEPSTVGATFWVALRKLTGVADSQRIVSLSNLIAGQGVTTLTPVQANGGPIFDESADGLHGAIFTPASISDVSHVLQGNGSVGISGSGKSTTFIVGALTGATNGDFRAVHYGSKVDTAGKVRNHALSASTRFNNGNIVWPRQADYAILAFVNDSGANYSSHRLYANGILISSTSVGSGTLVPNIDPQELIIGGGRNTQLGYALPFSGTIKEIVIAPIGSTDKVALNYIGSKLAQIYNKTWTEV